MGINMTTFLFERISEIIHAITYLCGQTLILMIFLEVLARKNDITKNGIIIPLIEAILDKSHQE